MGRELHISLEKKVAFLSDKNNYPHNPSSLEVRETHMSWIFLAGDLVYKMKKPVLYPYLDFSTLAFRKYFCEEEVRLNRRLAAEIYIDVIPLSIGPDENLSFNSQGSEVEWLVKMKRLPDYCMLDYQIQHQLLNMEQVTDLALLLVSFYKKQKLENLDGIVYNKTLAQTITDYLKELRNPDFGLQERELDDLLGRLCNFIEEEPLISQRGSRIVEGHGDLRPEHICVQKNPVIIDCLEFNRKLRLLDPAEELAYLAMECDFLEASWIGQEVIHIYQKELNDWLDPRVIQFYKCLRAVLRSLISFRHILESKYGHDGKWFTKGQRYFSMAIGYANLIAAIPRSRPGLIH